VVVGSSSTIDISLVEGEVLDEVVVVGYSTSNSAETDKNYVVPEPVYVVTAI